MYKLHPWQGLVEIIEQLRSKERRHSHDTKRFNKYKALFIILFSYATDLMWQFMLQNDTNINTLSYDVTFRSDIMSCIKNNNTQVY